MIYDRSKIVYQGICPGTRDQVWTEVLQLQPAFQEKKPKSKVTHPQKKLVKFSASDYSYLHGSIKHYESWLNTDSCMKSEEKAKPWQKKMKRWKGK